MSRGTGEEADARPRWRRPALLGAGAIAICALWYLLLVQVAAHVPGVAGAQRAFADLLGRRVLADFDIFIGFQERFLIGWLLIYVASAATLLTTLSIAFRTGATLVLAQIAVGALMPIGYLLVMGLP